MCEFRGVAQLSSKTAILQTGILNTVNSDFRAIEKLTQFVGIDH